MRSSTLWMVRHAQPLIASGVCYGQLDMQADPAATRQSAATLTAVLPAGAQLFSSPLQRCELLTIEINGLLPDLAVKRDARLQEMNFGAWEGRLWAEIDPAELAAWTDDFANYCAGGTGESVTQFMARVASAWDALDPSKDAVWVTHAGVIRAATLIASGVRHICSADQWPMDAPAYGQWCKLAIHPRNT